MKVLINLLRFLYALVSFFLGLLFLLVSMASYLSLGEYFSGIQMSETFDAGPAMGQLQMGLALGLPLLVNGILSFLRFLVNVRPSLVESTIGQILVKRRVLLNPITVFIVLLMLGFVLGLILYTTTLPSPQ